LGKGWSEALKSIKQAVILAGGLGTRLKPFTDEHPKPMYSFQNKPFIHYLIEQVKSFHIDEVVLLLGYKADEVIQYIDGNDFGITIKYNVTPVEYDTGNRLLSAKELLKDEFLLMYCDNYCPINFERLCSDFYNNEADIQLTAYANRDMYTKDNLRIAQNGEVTCYDKKRTQNNLKGVDIGYAIVKKKLLGNLDDADKAYVNFEALVYPQIVSNRKMYATVTEHRYYSIGSWERIKLTEQFFDNRKTVFLDRDGTINARAPKACYIEKPEDFKWLDGAIEAIKLLKERGCRLILVTNQPGIARGNLTEETLQQIHEKMQGELRQKTGYELDAIYYCPHNWDEGCECRKPRPGMLYRAQKEFSLNLTKCIMVGDDERDMEAGAEAGCTCYQVTEKKSLLDIVKNDIIK
jgi:D-glycero-D-manno-heptose 1,7-bisphosphate phosphatase